MPSYFFHLKLELYPAPAAAIKKKRLSPSSGQDTVFVPGAGSDIFSKLPTHSTTRWPSQSFDRRPDTPTSLSSNSEPESSPRQTSISGQIKPHGEALLLPERSLNLKVFGPRSPSLAPVKHTNEVAAGDWRYETVTIESIDMEAMSSSTAVGKPASGQVKSAVNGLHTKAVYLPSDPKTTEVGYGVVHLYRDTEESAVLGQDDVIARRGMLVDRQPAEEVGAGFDPATCNTLCILAVPSWMMPSDLLGFVGDQAREDVSHFRLIRTGRTNKYMVLMKFRSAKKAREWQKINNGRLFSAADPENCHIVFIRSVEFLSPDADVGKDATNFPQNTNDPFTTISKPGVTTKSLSRKPYAPPPPNLLELPTCPVCLERMDETTGLLTILCQHVFHCACLEKWRGSGCPVCRYTHTPSYTFPYPRPDHGGSADDSVVSEPLCSTCATTVGLWICLICGSTACGRYESAHAYAHYEATSHCYAMDVSTQRVWDYAGDGYVHRLIQSKPDSEPDSKPDSKLIDLPSRTRHENEAFRAEGGDSVPREKMENMANEYTYLLTSQLDGQRRYFEGQVERAVDKAAEASARAEEASTQAARAVAELDALRGERKNVTETLARVEAALAKSEKGKTKFESMAREMSTKFREEQTMNEGLVKRITAAESTADKAKKQLEEANEAKRELEDINHDLTVYISSQDKVAELQAAGEEVVDGSISLPVPVPEISKKKGKGRKNK